VLGTLLVLGAVCLGSPEAHAARPRVSIQPIAGEGGPRLRSQVVRVVRRRGFRVLTEIPSATGTGQYYTWAREAKLTAFVSGELENLGRRQRATFLVWSGNTGAIVGRWTVTAPTTRLPQAVARDFWRRLGRALHRAKPPAQWREPAPGPTLRIDAGSAHDGEVVGTHYSGRRRRAR
jgi:hypothetical protein